MSTPVNTKAEWLETDGLGGFASGTVSGIRSRRYHAVLLTAMSPPTGRVVLVNGWDAWVQTPAGNFAISSQLYAPDVLHPDGAKRIQSFEPEPWPRWRFSLEDGTQIEQELFMPKGAAITAVVWRLAGRREGVSLSLRPFLSVRDYHALGHENPSFRFDAEVRDGLVVWRPHAPSPSLKLGEGKSGGILALSNAQYIHQPDWYRHFLYEEERARGLDYTEDLASPGVFRWDLSRGEAVWLAAAEGHEAGALGPGISAEAALKKLRTAERLRRARFPSRLHRSADAYVVRRGAGKTIVAGYPWFTDWGRDTFIALRGLCLATSRLDVARDILLEWAGTVSEGMLPNRFPDQGAQAEFNSVDASLWFVIAVHDFLEATTSKKRNVTRREQRTLWDAVDAILDGYGRGTRYGIHLDHDGLLAAGEPGVALTWMDVDRPDIPARIGKPVEVQALWLNALWIRRQSSERWADLFRRGRETFQARFWNEAEGYLYDVVDCGHVAGKTDPAFRPNQILAVGGLPAALLEGERARGVVEAVETRLWTPLGLRSLAPGEPGYAPRYEGGPRERDHAYHQGTVWPWLIGPFVEAWVRVRGGRPQAKREAKTRYLEPLLRHLDEAGLGHVSEIADAEPPHTPRGCPFQAWSLGELLRLLLVVLAEEKDKG